MNENNDDVKIIMKNIKNNNKIINMKNLKKEEMKKKAEEREKRAELVREKNELKQNEKIKKTK